MAASEIDRLADAYLRSPGTDTLEALLAAVRASDPRFAFEREGRGDALAAVRAALPAIECDLFDAVTEDHACEVAAFEEVVCALGRAAARRA